MTTFLSIGVSMIKYGLVLLIISACSTGNKRGDVDLYASKKSGITAEERAKIFSSFDYVNKQVWAITQLPKDVLEYKNALKRVPNGSKKEDVLAYVESMELYTCPLTKNFVVCGYIPSAFTFCDDARIKLDRSRYKEDLGVSNKSIPLSESLGCK